MGRVSCGLALRDPSRGIGMRGIGGGVDMGLGWLVGCFRLRKWGSERQEIVDEIRL